MKDVIGGRYEIRRRIGAGGMATVYLAHDPLLSRDVAIKVPTLDRTDDGPDAETLQRFYAELRAIGRLNHPNVVMIYDGGEEDGTPYLVMEPVDGESLAQLIRREAPLPVERTVAIGRQIADALSYAHKQGIVHRDIKPQNVLLDAAGRVKVTDFGIAKSSDVTRTLTGTILGTPSFIAPEVAAGEPVTPAADIYSLGVVLYQMLTGHVPFESDNPIAAAVRSQREDAAPPSSLAPVPDWLDSVVLRALSRNAGERYTDAAQLAADLGAGHASGHAQATDEQTQRITRVGGSVLVWGKGRGRAVRQQRRQEAYQAQSEPQQPPTPKRRVLWLLPLIVLGAIAIGIALAVTHAPGQGGPPVPSPKTPPPSGSPNLLANGGLATNGPQPSGWRLEVFGGREPVRNWRPGGPGASDREITLESTSGTDSAWISSDVKVEPGWKLTLSGFIQTRSVPGDGPGAALRLVCAAADGKALVQASSQPVHGNAGWTQVQAQTAAPARTSTCSAQLRLGAPGKQTTGTAEFSRIGLVAG